MSLKRWQKILAVLLVLGCSVGVVYAVGKENPIPTLRQGPIADLQEQIATLQAENTALQNQVTGLQGQVTSLQSQLNTCNSQKSSLQSQLNTCNSQKAGLQSQLNTCNTAKTQCLSDRDDCLDDLYDFCDFGVIDTDTCEWWFD